MVFSFSRIYCSSNSLRYCDGGDWYCSQRVIVIIHLKISSSFVSDTRISISPDDGWLFRRVSPVSSPKLF